jgi:hypothetical protein
VATMIWFQLERALACCAASAAVHATKACQRAKQAACLSPAGRVVGATLACISV